MSAASAGPIIFLSPYVLCGYTVSQGEFKAMCKSLQGLLNRVKNAAIVLLFPVDVMPRQVSELKNVFGDRLVDAIPYTRSIHLQRTHAIHSWMMETSQLPTSFVILDSWDREPCYPDRQVYVDNLLRHEHLKQATTILKRPFSEVEFSQAISTYCKS